MIASLARGIFFLLPAALFTGVRALDDPWPPAAADETKSDGVDVKQQRIGLLAEPYSYETRTIRSSPRGDPATDSVFERVNIHTTGTTATALIVRDPARTLSVVVPPRGGCGHPATVSQSAGAHRCLAAVNAGFFDRRTGGCLGDLVSGGTVLSRRGATEFTAGLAIVRDAAGFGSGEGSGTGKPSTGAGADNNNNNNNNNNTEAGADPTAVVGTNITLGYFPPSAIDAPETVQFVSAVIWLVRDGKSVVDDAASRERPPHLDQTLPRFVSIRAGRVAVGFDAAGRAIIVKSDGIESDNTGLNLHELAALMIRLGAVQAVNLDGGGSSTMVIDGQLVGGAPQDVCPADHPFAGAGATCERNVTSILCIHEVPKLETWRTCVSLPTLRSVLSEEHEWKVVAIVSATAALVLGFGAFAVRHHYRRKQSEAMYDYVFDQDSGDMLDVLGGDDDDIMLDDY
jgi:hypothetical protein